MDSVYNYLSLAEKRPSHQRGWEGRNPSGPIAAQLLDPRKIQLGQTLQNAPLTITGGGDRANGDMGPWEST